MGSVIICIPCRTKDHDPLACLNAVRGTKHCKCGCKPAKVKKLPTIEDALAAKAEGMARAALNQKFSQEELLAGVVAVARLNRFFITDSVWDYLEVPIGGGTRGLGPVMRTARAMGVVKETDLPRQLSWRRHGTPMPVYESLIYSKVGTP